ncbi:hypothetical protein COT48_00515 [Candidatus Woesearchaeota archaeon CG08_land_8_20_14_0_20_47_9]|nr:MAG: hypothetical protein AUJ69_04115 [Candidatus Woesearchaeota archaeon CG1_02_47_18]PIO04424.1 MAG: hypothetical protein COT48_00515 [Candidatus Woesearchaeota archaeon CG08_land_8_20_14_0_20_47_9]HII29444.1 glycosyltransferase family 2 protein [Candidatus Woesearchaeota archaeon]
MQDNERVSIVIVNLNGERYLKECIPSILATDYPREKIEVILVDNGSTDNSTGVVRRLMPKAVIIENHENNYAKANNTAVKIAKSDLIAFLNNDTVVHKNWLRPLVKRINSSDDIAGVGSRIFFPDGRMQSAGLIDKGDFYWEDNPLQGVEAEQDRPVTAISGASALYKRACLEDAGLLDEDFNMYYEDVDLGLRITKQGLRILYVPESTIVHTFNGSIREPALNFFLERNRLYTVAKHWPEQLCKALASSRLTSSAEGHLLLQRMVKQLREKLDRHYPPERSDILKLALDREIERIINGA